MNRLTSRSTQGLPTASMSAAGAAAAAATAAGPIARASSCQEGTSYRQLATADVPCEPVAFGDQKLRTAELATRDYYRDLRMNAPAPSAEDEQ